MDKVSPSSVSNVIAFPSVNSPLPSNKTPPAPATPKFDRISERAARLAKLSKYPCEFDFDIYKRLETRFGARQPRGGVVFQSPFKLVNSHTTCQQCLYAFELDTYGRGCIHNCVYCYAKIELTGHGYWNRPFPMPADITEIWKTFYYAFETDKKYRWREAMSMRIPIRIGSMSDSFMVIDKKYKVTQELLKILSYYDYPYIIFTRSDLIAHDEYLQLLRSDLCSVQMSIASINDAMNRQIEPGAPSAQRRLKALQKLVRNGFWTTARLNPFFPIYPDGYFTDPDFDRKNMPEPFNYSSFEMIDAIADHGVQAILAGIVRLSGSSLKQIEQACGHNLREFYRENSRKTSALSERKSRDYHYSDAEVRAYYERIHAKCMQRGLQFTTCYIGNGEKHFWRDQDLWSNKKDCCNAIDRVDGFTKVKTARDVNWDTRMKYTSNKCLKPYDKDTLHQPLNPRA